MPWSGGAGRVTGLERRASEIAARLGAGSGVDVECADPGTWRTLGARNAFDPALAWALTPVDREPPSPPLAARRATLAPRTCRLLAGFAASPTERGTRVCRHALGDSQASPRSVVLGECDGWGATLVAVHVLSHESMHLAGVVDEALADCLAMQVDAVVARGLGASQRFAHRLADDYWVHYYRAQDRAYRSAACREGGAWDLFPGDGRWPTPRSPANVAAALAALVERQRA